MKKKDNIVVTKNKAELFEALNLSGNLAAECLDLAARLNEAWESGTLDILGPDNGAVGETLALVKDAAVAHWSAARKQGG